MDVYENDTMADRSKFLHTLDRALATLKRLPWILEVTVEVTVSHNGPVTARRATRAASLVAGAVLSILRSALESDSDGVDRAAWHLLLWRSCADSRP